MKRPEEPPSSPGTFCGAPPSHENGPAALPAAGYPTPAAGGGGGTPGGGGGKPPGPGGGPMPAILGGGGYIMPELLVSRMLRPSIMDCATVWGK